MLLPTRRGALAGVLDAEVSECHVGDIRGVVLGTLNLDWNGITPMVLKLRQRGWSQEKAAKAVGVGQQTVSDIERRNSGSNTETGNVSVPDLRLKVTGTQRRQILAEVEGKNPVKQVAADFGVSERRVRQIVRLECRCYHLLLLDRSI